MLPAKATSAMTKLSIKAHNAKFVLKKNAPMILFVGGCVAVVGSVAGIIHSTLKIQEIKAKYDKQIEEIKANTVFIYDQDGREVTDHTKEITRIHFSYAKELAKLYLPWILLMLAGMASQSIGFYKINAKALATAALLSTTTNSYDNYRHYIRDTYGEDADKAALAAQTTMDQTTIDNNSVRKETIPNIDTDQAIFRVFGPWDDTTYEVNGYWSNDWDSNVRYIDIMNHNYNNMFMAGMKNLFLNELTDKFGMSKKKKGQSYGYVNNNDSGKVFVELVKQVDITGPYGEKAKGLLLKFNVDGNILNMLPDDIAA